MMTVEQARELLRDLERVPVREWIWLEGRDRRTYYRYMEEWLRAKCLVDFKYHLWYGIWWKARKHYRGELFLRMADWLQEWRKPIKFLLVAREHRKSQMLLAYYAWRFAQDVNRRLLIRAFNTDPKAIQIAAGLQEIFECAEYRRLYPWVRPKMSDNGKMKKLWGSKGMMLERSDIGVRVPSVEVCGIDKSPVGGHFTDGLYDDFAVRENETSELLRQQLFEKFEEDDNLFMAGGRRAVAATIWAPDGFVDQARKRTERFSDKEYELFLQPGEVEQDFQPFTGSEIEMFGDRLTFRVKDNVFPTDANDIRYCQARLTFYNPHTMDTDVVVREVKWNTASEFAVNRPVETVYTGGPLSYTVGNVKPAAPSLFTMDVVDLMVPDDKAEEYVSRASLPQKRRNQGSYVYSAQVLLNPRPKESALFDVEKVRSISKQEFDEMVRAVDGVWYRKCDLSSAKRTGSYTAIVTGFVCFKGVFVRRIFWGLPKTHQTLFELFRTQLWLKQVYGASFRHTQLENAHIENELRQNLIRAQRDPYDFFKNIDDCKREAELLLKDKGSIHIIIKEETRGIVNKADRIRGNFDPVLEQERFYIVEGIEHEDRAYKEISEATLEALAEGKGTSGFDLLEVMSDLCAEAMPPKREAAPVEESGLYDKVNRSAARMLAISRLRGFGGYP